RRGARPLLTRWARSGGARPVVPRVAHCVPQCFCRGVRSCAVLVEPCWAGSPVRRPWTSSCRKIPATRTRSVKPPIPQCRVHHDDGWFCGGSAAASGFGDGGAVPAAWACLVWAGSCSGGGARSGNASVTEAESAWGEGAGVGVASSQRWWKGPLVPGEHRLLRRRWKPACVVGWRFADSVGTLLATLGRDPGVQSVDYSAVDVYAVVCGGGLVSVADGAVRGDAAAPGC